MITPELLSHWAERIGYFPVGGPAELAQELELGPLVVSSPELAEVETPPAGVRRLRLFEDVGPHRSFDRIEVVLAPPGLSLGALEARFGPGEPLGPLSTGSGPRRMFTVWGVGAPCTCTVFVSFGAPTEPTAESRTTEIMLRRNPAPAQ